jgi:RimJ/RimL family protein N-acetyltransferase
MKPVILHTERLTLEAPTVADVDAIALYCQDPLFERVLTTPWPYTREHALEFATEFAPHGWRLSSEYAWALRLRGQFLGVASFRPPASDVGFWIGEPHRGHGYMTEAVGGILDWVFGTGVEEVSWQALAGNTASASVARKTGFTFTGERESTHVHRGGIPAQAWHARIRAEDSRDIKPGWPA